MGTLDYQCLCNVISHFLSTLPDLAWSLGGPHASLFSRSSVLNVTHRIYFLAVSISYFQCVKGGSTSGLERDVIPHKSPHVWEFWGQQIVVHELVELKRSCSHTGRTKTICEHSYVWIVHECVCFLPPHLSHFSSIAFFIILENPIFSESIYFEVNH